MFKVKGNITDVLEDQKIGNFVIRGFVIITGGEKPKTMKFDLWNEKTTLVERDNIGSVVEVGFDIESKLAKERYFTNLRAYYVSVDSNSDEKSTTVKSNNKRVVEDEIDLPF